MLQIPGWLTGLIVLVLVIALGFAATLPRQVSVQVNNHVENTNNAVYNDPVTYHYNNHHQAGPAEEDSEDDG